MSTVTLPTRAASPFAVVYVGEFGTTIVSFHRSAEGAYRRARRSPNYFARPVVDGAVTITLTQAQIDRQAAASRRLAARCPGLEG